MISYMRRDSKLSSVLHVLLHMAQQDRPFTSEELAQFLDTNPALVRRTLAGLRERGYIASTKGHGGGWRLACNLGEVTLRDVYDALDRPPVFAMGNRSEQPDCLVEQVVNQSLASAFDEAEALLISRFAGVTLRELSDDFNRRYAAHPRGKEHHGHA